jgi:hypothetical protein
MLAGLMRRLPEFNKTGSRKVPRAWRALKGWRKLCPSRSRGPYPLAIWAALIWRFVCRQRLDMGSFLLMLLSTYCRPSQLLKLRRMDLMEPMGGGQTLVHVASPQELPAWSKIGESDVSMALDSKWMEWATPLYLALRAGGGEAMVWEFTWPQFTRVFRSCCKELKLDGLVPYQTRRSGPSIDRSQQPRMLTEVQRRGGWQTHRSLVRCERSARLSATFSRLSSELQACCKTCEAHLAEIVLADRCPEIHLPRETVCVADAL